MVTKLDPHHIVRILLGAVTLTSIHAFTNNKFESGAVTEKQIAADIHEIKKQLPDFQRSDFKQIPYLIQRVNLDSSTTEYLLPPQEPGQTTANVAFTRHNIDTHLSVVVFQTGLYNWQPSISRKYVVLRRHSKKTPVYFLTYAYVRQNGIQRVIEWEVQELSISEPKSRIEKEICRGEKCGLPEWILGTCSIEQHKCSIKLEKIENETIFKNFQLEEQDEDSDEALNFKDDSESSQEDEMYNRRRRRDASKSRHNVKLNVPSSLDLLFLQNPENISRKTNDRLPSHFYSDSDSTKQKKRNIPSNNIQSDQNLEEVLHILKCQDCQKSDNFLDDLEEQVGLNRILGEKLQLEFKNMTQKRWPNFPWNKRPSKFPYVGYGTCAYLSIEGDLKKPSSNEMDDVIEFYLDTLRLDCDNVLKNEIRGWLTSKWRFIRIVQDLSFELIPDSKLLTYSMLTPKEFETLMSALLFLKYSTVYREASSNQNGFRLNLLGRPLSTRISFLTRVFFKVIDVINKHLKHHTIKISRELARNLKDKFYSLLLAQNFIHVKKSSKQEHLWKQNYRDRIQIMAIKEFVLYGLNPIFRSGTPTDVAFQSFYQLNENRIRFLVHSYGFDKSNKN